MAHETRTQIDAVWVNGYVVPRTDWESLDAKAFRAVNGDQGGAWAPWTEIEIQGTGLQCSGPLEVRGAGVLTVEGNASVVLGDTADFQDLAPNHVGQTRKIVQTTIPFCVVKDERGNGYPWGVTVNRAYASAQTMALVLQDSAGNRTTPEFLVPLRVHDGAILSKVVPRPDAAEVLAAVRDDALTRASDVPPDLRAAFFAEEIAHAALLVVFANPQGFAESFSYNSFIVTDGI